MDENTQTPSIERLYSSAKTTLDYLTHLSLHGDQETAEKAARILENVTRRGINSLCYIAENRVEVLKPHARLCSDWPAFTPEHAASKRANEKMCDLLELRKDVANNTKGKDIGSELQEIVWRMYLDICEAKEFFNHSDLSKRSSLPEWMRTAASLPPIEIEDGRKQWFECAWDALKHDWKSDPEAHPTIRKIGLEMGAKERAENTNHKRLSRLNQKLKKLEEAVANEKLKHPWLKSPAKIQAEELRKEIELKRNIPANILHSQVIACAKEALWSAFDRRIKSESGEK